MSRIFINGYWTTIEKLEKEFGIVEFEDKKYILTSQADHTNRLLPYQKNYHEVEENEEFDFEMSAGAVDENGNEFIIYWIFSDIKGNEAELDSFDYNNINRIEEL